MRRSAHVVAALAFWLPLAVSGQRAPSLGDRVRLRSPDGANPVGVVTSVTPDSVEVRQLRGRTEVWYATADWDQLERSLGRERSFGKNFGITLGVSTGAIALISAIAWSPCTDTGFVACDFYPLSRMRAFGYGMVGGALIGLPLGVIVGLAANSEKWEPISVPGRKSVAIEIVPIVGRRVGLAGSISFGR